MTGNHTTANKTSNDLNQTGTKAVGYSSDVATSTTVIMAVADERGVESLDLDVRLNDVVDPDALDALVESMNEGYIEFSIADYHVRVQASGNVFVGPSR